MIKINKKKEVSLLLVVALILTVSVGDHAISAARRNGKAAAKVSSVKITNTGKKLRIQKGKKFKLKTKVKVKPARSRYRKLKFSSTNKKIVSVNSRGIIKGVEVGNAKVTAASKINPKKKARITVTVTAGQNIPDDAEQKGSVPNYPTGIPAADGETNRPIGGEGAKSPLPDEPIASPATQEPTKQPEGSTSPDSQRPTGQPGDSAVPASQKPMEQPGNSAAPATQRPTGQPGNSAAPASQKPTGQPGNSAAPATQKPTKQPGNSAAPASQKPTKQPGNSAAPSSQKPTKQPGNSAAPASQKPAECPGNSAVPASQKPTGQPENSAAPASQKPTGQPGKSPLPGEVTVSPEATGKATQKPGTGVVENVRLYYDYQFSHADQVRFSNAVSGYPEKGIDVRRYDKVVVRFTCDRALLPGKDGWVGKASLSSTCESFGQSAYSDGLYRKDFGDLIYENGGYTVEYNIRGGDLLDGWSPEEVEQIDCISVQLDQNVNPYEDSWDGKEKGVNFCLRSIEFLVDEEKVEPEPAEAAALREIIAEQRALGAKVSEDLNDLQYVWNQEGRLEEIRWGGVSLSGDVSFSAFQSLKKLNLWVNRLDSLDVSQNVMLKRLDCARNQLKSLDVSHNVVLQTLICDSNQLTSLDVSQNVMLQTMSCDSNQLTSLDVSQNTELERLWCSENQLGSLDLTNNKKIRYFNVDEGVEVIGYQPKPTATPEPTVDPNEKVENVMLDYGKDGYLFSRAEQVEFPA